MRNDLVNIYIKKLNTDNTDITDDNRFDATLRHLSGRQVRVPFFAKRMNPYPPTSSLTYFGYGTLIMA